jgi:hypothetical protein
VIDPEAQPLFAMPGFEIEIVIDPHDRSMAATSARTPSSTASRSESMGSSVNIRRAYSGCSTAEPAFVASFPRRYAAAADQNAAHREPSSPSWRVEKSRYVAGF